MTSDSDAAPENDSFTIIDQNALGGLQHIGGHRDNGTSVPGEHRTMRQSATQIPTPETRAQGIADGKAELDGA